MKQPKSVLMLFALAGTACAAGAAQPPPASHPSAAAHATAAAGQANASRIEACAHASETFIDNLDQGDYQAATSNFGDEMQAALDADRLGKAWDSVGKQFGKLEDRGAPQNVIYQGMAVITTPLHFQKGDLAVQVACGDDGRFAGFHVLPVSSPAEATSSATH